MIIYFNKTNHKIIATVDSNISTHNTDSYIEALSKYNFLEKENIDFIITENEEYREFLKGNLKDCLFYIDGLDRTLKTKPIEKNDNKFFIYSNHNYKREYTFEQVKEMYYKDYIDYTLKNVVQNNIFEVKFIPIKDLNIRSYMAQKRWEHFDDPFLAESYKDKLALGRDIVKRGTYYPFIVTENNEEGEGQYMVLEGNHRMMSLKFLVEEGELEENFEVLCIIFEETNTNELVQKYNILPISTRVRYVIETKYGDQVVENSEYLRKVLHLIEQDGGHLINDYTVECSAYSQKDVIFSLHSYPLWIRDLMYPYNNEIEPSLIINDKETFERWKK